MLAIRGFFNYQFWPSRQYALIYALISDKATAERLELREIGRSAIDSRYFDRKALMNSAPAPSLSMMNPKVTGDPCATSVVPLPSAPEVKCPMTVQLEGPKASQKDTENASLADVPFNTI